MYTKWLVAGILTIGIGFHHLKPSVAQDHKGIEHKKQMEVHHQKLLRMISATPEQEEKIHVTMKKYFQSLDAIKSDRSLDEAKIKQKMGAAKQQMEAALNKILTPEQRKAVQAKGGIDVLLHAGEFNPYDLLKKLDLTPAQESKLRAMKDEIHAQMAAVKQDGSLSDSEKKLRIEALHHEGLQRLHSVLTPEQMKKLQQMHQDGGNKTIPPQGR